MRIGSLLFIFTLALVLSTSLVVGLIGYKVSQATVTRGYKDSLTQARISKTRILETTFSGFSNAVISSADLLSTRSAIKELSKGQHEIIQWLQTKNIPENFRKDLMTEYGATSDSEVERLISRLTNFPAFLQGYFYQEAKSKGTAQSVVLDVPAVNKLSYFRHHSNMQARYLDYLERYKVTDIFLIDHTGTVLYSVEKRLELGTNLITGPFQNTALSEAYRWTISAAPHTTRFFDFTKALYPGAVPTAYLAAPVFEKDQFIGSIVYGIPLSIFDNILSDHHQWQQNGLMQTGEVLAFSLDGELRSNLRTYYENPEAYEANLGQLPDAIRDNVIKDKTTALNISLSEGQLRELREKSELVEVAPHFLGTASILSVGRVPLPGGGQWILIARMHYAEAIAPLKNYLVALGLSVLFITLLAMVALYYLARHLLRPIQNVSAGLQDLRENRPTSILTYEPPDELGELVAQYNETTQKIEGSTVTKLFLDSVIQSLNELLFVIKINYCPETNKTYLKIQNVNKAASEMIGVSQEELRNTDLNTWLDADLDSILTSFTETSPSSQRLRGEGHLRQLSGERVPLQITWSKLEEDPSHEGDLVLVGSDIRWRKEIEKKILENKELLHESQAMSRTGSFLWDFNSGESIWTDEVFHIFGLSPTTITASRELFFSLLIPEDRQLFELEITEARIKIRPLDITVRARRADTQDGIWLHIMGRFEFDDYGNPTKTLGSIQDVTQLKKSELELIATKNEALKSSQAKSEFLARMSHEIRTPMNAIMGMAELLMETKLDKDQRYYVTVFCKAGEVLMTLINDILDLSKIEAGEVSVENIPFELSKVLSDVSDMMRPRGLEKGLEITFDVAPGISPHLMGDPTKLNQVLINLVGNALKFTERGLVRINVIRNPTKKDSLIFSVSDTGFGIPVSKQHLIFQKFSQADSTISRKYGGTGLGLAISKSLVELMGGQIWFKSREGMGTTFFFTTPYREQILNPMTHQPLISKPMADFVPTKSKAPDRKLRILLADDTDDNRTLFMHYLKNTDYEIVEAQNGLEAVEKIKSNRFDIVFMDVQMPEMDGYAATAAIREWEKDQHMDPTPIIALTAHALSDDRKRSLRMGCDDHITKPFKKDTLIDVINRYSH